MTTSKGEMSVVKSENKKESPSSEHAGSAKSDSNSESKSEDIGDGKKEENCETSEVALDNEEKDGNNNGETAVALQAVTKPTKKKIVRKVVKLKAANKTLDIENSDSKQSEKPNTKDAGESETPDGSSGGKTFVRKVVVKKSSTSENSQKGMQSEEKSETETMSTETEAKEKADSGVKQGNGMKTTVKKKVIKKVTKKKAAGGEANAEEGDIEKVSEVDKQQKKVAPTPNSETCSGEKQDTPMVPSAKAETQDDKVNTGKEAADEKIASTVADTKGEKGKIAAKEAHDGKKLKEGEKSKDDKEKRKAKLDGEVKEKKNEEPPRPGFILQTKAKKDSKVG